MKRFLAITAIDISPTPFSPFGVIAMWAIFAVALLAALRRRLELRSQTWRTAHMLLAIVIVVGSVVHGILIEGAMETVSKAALCALVLAATVEVMVDLRVWRKRKTLRAESIARQQPNGIDDDKYLRDVFRAESKSEIPD